MDALTLTEDSLRVKLGAAAETEGGKELMVVYKLWYAMTGRFPIKPAWFPIGLYTGLIYEAYFNCVFRFEINSKRPFNIFDFLSVIVGMQKVRRGFRVES